MLKVGFPIYNQPFGLSLSNPIFHAAGRGFLHHPTMFCTKRLSSKVPSKPDFQSRNANSRIIKYSN